MPRRCSDSNFYIRIHNKTHGNWSTSMNISWNYVICLHWRKITKVGAITNVVVVDWGNFRQLDPNIRERKERLKDRLIGDI